MNDIEFKQIIRKRLLQIESAEESFSNPDQIRLRCQFCGDSKKDPNKKRLGIRLNMNDNTLPIFYNCFNCGASGILTPSILRTFKIHDLQLNSALLAYNKATVGAINKQLGIKNNTFNFDIPKPYNTETNKRKKKYIETRMGIDISVDELIRLKTIFSFKQFIVDNEINNLHIGKRRIEEFENNYVGFLTAKNEFINFRDVTGKEKLRYDKYPIFLNLDNTRKFYTIPSRVDVMSSEPININIAEGVFDILGVYFHLCDRDNIHNVYTAVCGSAYTNVIKYFFQLGIIGDNVTVNIFSDSDKSPYYYKEMYNELSPWVGAIDLYYNIKSKDFGVPKKEIEVVKRRIK